MSLLAPIICDNGTGFSKVGYAGNSDPSFVFPTAIATRGPAVQSSRAGPAVPSKPGNMASKRGVEDLDFFIGDEALANAKTPGYGVNYPNPSRTDRELGLHGALLGADNLQIPQGGARGPLFPAHRTPSERAREP
ncbi:hypothetical protein NM688_g8921 [Phlebia brevispora]|uniref:Uncharacterized protein n=1 Tax=Phlebia brevispora TaxID=194682 RepID=A0ACC1RMW3_9APHY|nr:hypothetical protein NM688_g8921 [Phlebia brevispora]